MRKTDYKSEYKKLVRAGKISEAKSLLHGYRQNGEWNLAEKKPTITKKPTKKKSKTKKK